MRHRDAEQWLAVFPIALISLRRGGMSMSRSRSILVAAAVCALGAGCSSFSEALSPKQVEAQAVIARQVQATPNPSHPWLYVAGNSSNSVQVYDLGKLGYPNVESITQGVSSPAGIALDGGGNLYVPNQSANDVTIYAPQSSSPSLTLTGVAQPQDVTLDPKGNVYVAFRGGGAGIAVYGPGQKTPSEVITSSLIQVPNQLVFGSDGTLYVTDNNTGVLTIAPGSTSVESLGLQGLEDLPSGLAIDPVSQAIYVSNAGTSAFIQEYKEGKKTPSRTVPLPGDAFYLGIGVIRKQRERLFVPNSRSGQVYVYSADLRYSVLLKTVSGIADGVPVKPAGVP
jgi:hypothetical protein